MIGPKMPRGCLRSSPARDQRSSPPDPLGIEIRPAGRQSWPARQRAERSKTAPHRRAGARGPARQVPHVTGPSPLRALCAGMARPVKRFQPVRLTLTGRAAPSLQGTARSENKRRPPAAGVPRPSPLARLVLRPGTRVRTISRARASNAGAEAGLSGQPSMRIAFRPAWVRPISRPGRLPAKPNAPLAALSRFTTAAFTTAASTGPRRKGVAKACARRSPGDALRPALLSLKRPGLHAGGLRAGSHGESVPGRNLLRHDRGRRNLCRRWQWRGPGCARKRSRPLPPPPARPRLPGARLAGPVRAPPGHDRPRRGRSSRARGERKPG